MAQTARFVLGGGVVAFAGVLALGCAAASEAEREGSGAEALRAPDAMPDGQYELDLSSRVCSKEKTPVDVEQPGFGSGQRQFFRFDEAAGTFQFRAYAEGSTTCWAQVGGPFSLDTDALTVTSQSSSSPCGGVIALASHHSFAWTDATAKAFRLASSAAEIGHGVCPRGYPWLLTTWSVAPAN